MKPVCRFLPIVDSRENEGESKEYVENLSTQALWKLLIVDDEEDVHALTRLALQEFTFEGKGVTCISAKSANCHI